MFKQSRQRLAAMPWAKTFKAAAWFVAGFTLLVGVPGAGFSYTDFGSFLSNMALTAGLTALFALYGVFLFTIIWITHDVPGGVASFNKFWREFPENWRWFWRSVGAVLYWILMLPFAIGRGVDRFFSWLGSVPGKWRATPAKDKRATLLMGVMFFVMGGIGYQYWELASRWASALPDWVMHGDVLVPTLFITVMLTAFTMILGSFVLAVLSEVVRAVARRMRGTW